ncbi:tetraspanin-11 [Tripterygium wilfordii]|uniref:Tetraspanin-11 n=1 Tax=Tripterygium wilfordii TaxID=458696 RepID=A0A7J7CJ61_TRIWF|nr:tetraspanin-11 [Tripterygium wilfordii]
MAPRLSNTLVATLNFFSLLLGIVLIILSTYFHAHRHTSCQRSLDTPLLIMGFSLLVVSLLGFIGSCCRENLVLDLYMFFLCLLIAGLVVFTIFVLVVTNKSAGRAVSGLGFEGAYRVGDSTHWLQKHFVDGKRWEEFRRCMAEAQICKSVSYDVDFFKKRLSPIQSGCCKPPTYCGFKAENATLWRVPKAGPAVPDSDCRTWSNRQDELCYKCKSCKAGVLANIRLEWRLLGICNAGLIVFVMIIFSIALCARENNVHDLKDGRCRSHF